MRMHVISDNVDTLIGFRLAGVKGAVVHEREEALKSLIRLATTRTQDILVTELLSENKRRAKTIKLDPKMPIVTVIPIGTHRGRITHPQH